MNGYLQTARARFQAHANDDEGTSLVELLVGMVLMTIFMAIFLTSMLVIFNTANKVEATSVSSAQTNAAFLRLDKTIRYASAISTSGVSATSGDWYVEMTSPPTTVGGSDTCSQLRIDSSRLQQRSWAVTSGTAGTASGWTTIASYLTNGAVTVGSPDVPFVAPTASTSTSTTFQRLQIVLVSTSGNATTSTNRTQMSFTALNSDVSLPSNATTCQQWGRP